MNAGAAATATASAYDAELVKAVRCGEGSAFEELFRRYQEMNAREFEDE